MKKNFVLLYIFALPLSFASDNSESLEQKYTKLYNSFLGSHLQFKCGDEYYKVEKKFIGDNIIYIKDGIEWKRISQTVLKPLGLAFFGTIKVSEFDINTVNFDNIQLPIFNHPYLSSKRNNKSDYFSLVNKSGELYVGSVIDFKVDIISSSNIYETTALLVFNNEKYFLEQKKIPMGHMYDDNYREKQNKLLNERIDTLNMVSQRFEKPNEIKVPKLNVELKSYCY